MRRQTAVVAVLVLVVAAALAPVGGLAASDGGQGTATDASGAGDTAAGNESETAVAPGERLSGVVAVGQSEVETEVEARAFDRAVTRASNRSDNATAAVVSERVADLDARIQALEQRSARLERARQNGTISEGLYRARMAHVAADLRGATRLANQTENASRGVPAGLLAERGVDATAIQTIREHARDVGGRDLAELARQIAGPAVGSVPGHAGAGGPPVGAPDPQGPPGDGNASAGDADDSGPDTTSRPERDSDERSETGDRDDGA